MKMPHNQQALRFHILMPRKRTVLLLIYLLYIKIVNDKDLVFLANPNRIAGKMVPREKITEAIAAMKSGRPAFCD